MKRIYHTHKEKLRKSWCGYRLAPIAFSISTVLFLTACEKSDQTVSLYQNADDCSKAHPSMNQQCVEAYQVALKEATKTSPKYASREDCIAEFGQSQCTKVTSEQADILATSSTADKNSTVQPQEICSMWMPLMAGYMMGKMMGGGFNQQPLFTSQSSTSPMKDKFVDATGKNYGAATYGRTMNLPKSALAPKPSVTKTLTRGGFGQTVAQHSSMKQGGISLKSFSRGSGR
ncbi:DUF1190 family protein [Candidatus Williamhamiltonella defendens]|uniref:DUF1190 family protein n=1 Tax=Candidatus Williamhamiltonella defendens TaxID=138072 RepID=UPI00130E37EC|nr:DUF1190 family protein [Candidatus Hamiltonella defensa]